MAVSSRPDVSGTRPDIPRRLPPVRIIAVLVAIQVIVSLAGTVPGCLSIDEGIYRWMAKDFSATGSLEIRTGYRELPSAEMTNGFLPPHGGRTLSRFPYLFPVLAAPFYKLAGFTGLFVLNNLAFLATLGLTWLLARRLFRDEGTARLAALLFACGTFAWEYSQAAWPHAVSSLFVLGAFTLAMAGLDEASPRRRTWMAALSGLVAGFAPGLRLDGILILPVVLALFLYRRPWRPKAAAAVLLGSLPGLVVLGLTNRAKFGTFRLFSYGAERSLAGFLTSRELLIVLVVLLVPIWAFTRAPVRAALRGPTDRTPKANQVWPWLAMGVALAALLAIPSIRQGVWNGARYAYTLVVDASTHVSRHEEPALRRSPGGGLVYLGAQKTALLQGLPWLVVLLLPAVRIVRRGPQASILGSLLLVPAAFVAFDAVVFPDHGGLGLNLRYLVPALPFFGLLGAWSMREMREVPGIHHRAVATAAVAAATIVGLALLIRYRFQTADTQEFLLLRAPLILAAALAAAIVAAFLLRPTARRFPARLAGILLATALGWSAFVAFGYDFPHHRRQRAINRELARRTAEVLPAGSLLLTAPYVDPFLALIEHDGTRLGFPDNDKFSDLPRLVAHERQAGRPVFAVFRFLKWNEIMRGPLAAYDSTPVYSFEEYFDNGPNLRFVGKGSVPSPDPQRRFVLATIR